MATDLLGTPPDDVVLAPPGSVLKTSSGKLRRAASRERYEQGDLGKRQRAVWWQITRLALTSILPQVRRVRQAFLVSLCCLRLGAVWGRVARGVGDHCPPVAAVLVSGGSADESTSLAPAIRYPAQRAGTGTPATS